MQKLGDQDSPSQSGIRRSNRNRIPNPIYKEGIKELKRSFKNGKMREGDSGLDDSDVESENASSKSDSTEWMKCNIGGEDGEQKELFVAIKINKPIGIMRKESFNKTKPPVPKPKDGEKKFDEELRKQRKKSLIQEPEPPAELGGMGLYKMLLNAAQKALAPNPQLIPDEENEKDQATRERQRKLKKQSKQQRDGKLLGVKLKGNQLVFQHSKLKTVEVQLKPEPIRLVVEDDPTFSCGLPVEVIRDAFENHKKNTYTSSIFI